MTFPIAERGPSRDLVKPVYQRLEHRAAILMGGWEHCIGVTPDDLAQAAVYAWTGLRERYPDTDAYRLASYRLQQDITKLRRRKRGPSLDQVQEDRAEDGYEPLDWAAPEAVRRYFRPETVDGLAELLTPRELDVILARYEDDLTQKQAAEQLGCSISSVTRSERSALNKIHTAIVSNNSVTEEES